MTMQEGAVVLTDEDGNDVEFDHLMTFGYEGETYVALMPVDETEGIGEDEVVILRIVKNGDEEALEAIDNDVLLDEVFDEFLELMDEQEEADEKG